MSFERKQFTVQRQFENSLAVVQRSSDGNVRVAVYDVLNGEKTQIAEITAEEAVKLGAWLVENFEVKSLADKAGIA